MASGKQGKVAALVLDQPGAPNGWHFVDGMYVHPEIPVPYERAAQYVKDHTARLEDARKAWDEFEQVQEQRGHRLHGRLPFVEPPCPVKVVYVTEQEAQDGLDSLNEARGQAARLVREALRSGDGTEVVLAHEEAAALGGEG